MSQRAERVAHLLQRELNELLREIRDPRVQEATLITITHVHVSDDLGVAKVMVSVVAADRTEVIRGIGRTQRFLQSQLLRRLRARKIPELRFYLDDTEERAGRIDELLREISAEPPVGESSDPGKPGTGE
jgi:ribosome-binding factor A